MIEKINNNQMSDILKDSSVKQPEQSDGSVQDGADASLQVSYDSLIEQAQQLPQDDASVVQQAQELISSGQLESPEAIQAAAESIIKFGV